MRLVPLHTQYPLLSILCSTTLRQRESRLVAFVRPSRAMTQVAVAVTLSAFFLERIAVITPLIDVAIATTIVRVIFNVIG